MKNVINKLTDLLNKDNQDLQYSDYINPNFLMELFDLLIKYEYLDEELEDKIHFLIKQTTEM